MHQNCCSPTELIARQRLWCSSGKLSAGTRVEKSLPNLQAVKLHTSSILTVQGMLYGAPWYLLWDRGRCVGVQGRGRDKEFECKAYPGLTVQTLALQG